MSNSVSIVKAEDHPDYDSAYRAASAERVVEVNPALPLPYATTADIVPDLITDYPADHPSVYGKVKLNREQDDDTLMFLTDK